MEACVRLEHVSVRFEDVTAINDLSVEIHDGEFVTIIGRSGCGKTTTLRLVNGLQTPEEGRVFVRGEDVAKADLIRLRRSIGYAIQDVGLFPHMTVAQNISYVPSLSGRKNREETAERVRELLQIVGLEEEMAKRRPAALSGGQKQRVGIARAIAANPSILLMDEPFGAVDEITRRGLQKEILRLQQDLGMTVIFVTHDIHEAMLLGGRMLVMDAGRIVRDGAPEEIRQNPGSDLVRELLAL